MYILALIFVMAGFFFLGMGVGKLIVYKRVDGLVEKVNKAKKEVEEKVGELMGEIRSGEENDKK